MPGRQQEPSFQLPSGTTVERDGSYNLTTVGNIFYNTDTSNVEIRHVDPSNSLDWRDLVINNKEQIDISGKLVVEGGVVAAPNIVQTIYKNVKTLAFPTGNDPSRIWTPITELSVTITPRYSDSKLRIVLNINTSTRL